MDKNRMKIICNPFKKEIEYQWYDSNIRDYVDNSETSELEKPKYKNTTIHNRAYEIVGVINDEKNKGNVGLEIVFTGTSEDYQDFCRAVSTYAQKSGAKIECRKDNEQFYHTASFVMPEIEEQFKKIKELLEECRDDEISNQLKDYNEVVRKSRISLCVVGLYSSGKSAFINSLIGKEVLPSGSDPTTGQVCEIHCDRGKYEIRFQFDGKECILKFEGDKYKPEKGIENDIMKELQNIGKEAEKHDEISHMNEAIKILNNYKKEDGKHEISEVVEIYLPFGKTNLPTDKFDFIIYDMPGSNSNSNEYHFEALKKCLGEQANALPIFVTTPETMDATDNNEILSVIENNKSALDIVNTIVILNKADELGTKELNNKQEKNRKLRIKEWRSAQIFFMSSILGIASKKQNPDEADEWIDGDLYELYEEKNYKYSKDKKKLFKYNIMDEGKKSSSDYSSDEKADHLYKNSGLEAIEMEIADYASRYALYEKCQRAAECLQDAIDPCMEIIQRAETDLSNEWQKVKEKFDVKQQELISKLEEKKKEVTKEDNTEFQKRMEDVYNNFMKEKDKSKKVLSKNLKNKWKELKEKEKKENQKGGWAVSQIEQYVSALYNDDLLRPFSGIANQEIDNFWSDKSESFKKQCIDIVRNSSALTDKQKKVLEQAVQSKSNMAIAPVDLDLRKTHVIKHKKIVFIIELRSEIFDYKKCSNQIMKSFNGEVRNHLGESVKENNNNFTTWMEDLLDILTRELCTFNSELAEYANRIKDMETDIERKKKSKKVLKENSERINELLSIQIGGGEGVA